MDKPPSKDAKPKQAKQERITFAGILEIQIVPETRWSKRDAGMGQFEDFRIVSKPSRKVLRKWPLPNLD